MGTQLPLTIGYALSLKLIYPVYARDED